MSTVNTKRSVCFSSVENETAVIVDVGFRYEKSENLGDVEAAELQAEDRHIVDILA